MEQNNFLKILAVEGASPGQWWSGEIVEVPVIELPLTSPLPLMPQQGLEMGTDLFSSSSRILNNNKGS